MGLSYTVLSGTFEDGQGNPLSGTVEFSVNVPLYASGVPVVVPDVPVQAQITAGQLLNSSGGALQLLDLASTGLVIEGNQTGFWFWTASITVGGVAVPAWSFFLQHSSTPVDLYSLANTGSGGGSFLPLPSGTATAGYVPIATGTGEASAWGSVSSGTLPLTTLGDTLYEDATPAPARLAGNTSATRKFLRQVGNGTVSAAPAWDTLQAPDLPAATTGAQGAVQLAGDLGGTAASPQVTGTHLASPLPIAQGGTGTATGAPQNDVFAGPASGGAAAPAFRALVAADLPGATSGAIGAVQLAGDLGGTATSPQVTGTHLAAPLPIAQGGTGSATQNFVDLTTGQSIGGTKTFTGEVVVPAPVNSGDAVTKAYADAIAQGLSVKPSVRVATTGSETFTIASGSVTQIAGTSVDGVSPSVNDRILVKDAPASTGAGSPGSTQPGNGIYVVTNTTTNLTLSRATDMSGTNAPAGAFSFTEAGTANAGAGFVVTTPSSNAGFTYGTNNIAWTQFSGAGEITAGTGLTKSGNTISLSNPVTIALGGTGQATQQAALDALAGAVTSGQVLRGNGTHVQLAALQAGDVPTLNQNTTGNANTATNLAGAATLPARVTGHVVTLTDGSSVAVDASLGNIYDWPLGGGSHTLAVPTNPVNGDSFTVRIAYSGSFTPLFASGAGGYSFGADGQPAWTATNASVDLVGFSYNGTLGKWCCQGWKLGFS